MFKQGNWVNLVLHDDTGDYLTSGVITEDGHWRDENHEDNYKIEYWNRDGVREKGTVKEKNILLHLPPKV